MKIHAIGYFLSMADTDKERLRFFIYPSKKLDEKTEIRKELYTELKKFFNKPYKYNDRFFGRFFEERN